MYTLRFLRDLIVNPPLVWEDGDGNVIGDERMTRRDRWQIFRPLWTYTFLTVERDCGCCRRLGLWPVIWCGEHVSGGDDE